ncbi:hypothetical protein Rhe02_21210 [Rhizocola hellebori]|uniref:Leucine rich repeat variant n=1 Tax=Rhizocola hellebori TaxID=1392758 RepID=A0A8J3Q612_9ACTN|nr:hypothetical protein [Rhizocola hellebori]GIH04054.1 hypothetical protein Rhe02_21210 [Rhizocola hellebori]
MSGDAWLDESPFPIARLAGLARNPTAPTGLLIELMRHWPDHAAGWLRRRAILEPPLQDAMQGHHSARIRGALASHPDVSPSLRAALLNDESWRVRTRAFGRPEQRPLSDETLTQLLADLDQPPRGVPMTRDELLNELLWADRHDGRLLELAARHPRPGIRQLAAQYLNVLHEDSRQALLDDPVVEVRSAAADNAEFWRQQMLPADLPQRHCHEFWAVLHRSLSPALVDHVLASGDIEAMRVVAENPTTPPDAVAVLLDHPDAEVRQRLSRRADLNGEQLAQLAADPAARVRTAVSVHPGLTEQQRAEISIDLATVPCDGYFGHPDATCDRGYHIDSPVPPLDEAIRGVRSVNPLLRRAAARNPTLPDELVAALETDSDFGVRVLLAQHHPSASPSLLLQSFVDYRGCGRRRLIQRPLFPTVGTARLAVDPDPAVRRLAVRDPDAESAVISHLSDDPDLTVRRAAAACPRLPISRIMMLLDDPELAEDAAANPALPPNEMWRILSSSPWDQRREPSR